MIKKMKDKYDVGVIVGRFQIAELTNAHKQIINDVKDTHNQYVIVIGVSPTLGTKQNPLSYTARMRMLQQIFPDAIITYLMDENSDSAWSKNLDKLIRSVCPIGNICLYGGRDSFINCYSGYFPTFEFALIPDSEGTHIREEIGKNMYNSVDFRRGIIHSCQNQYPKAFPTVDIAVIKKENNNIKVLMGRRVNKKTFRFPGGFVDPADDSFEDAAVRELFEEIDVAIDRDEIKYICTNNQKDWRYSKQDERIVTTLFSMPYVFGAGTPKSEFESSEWILVSPESLAKIEDSHKVLFEKLVSFYNKKGKSHGKKLNSINR